MLWFLKILKLLFTNLAAQEAVSILLELMPRLSRSGLIESSSKSGHLYVVQDSYTARVPASADPLTRARFSRFEGEHHVAPFFAARLTNVRLLGPYAIPITRKGQIVVEPFGERWLRHVIRTTVAEMGLRGFLIQYMLALAPFSWIPGSQLSSAAHLIPRASQEAGGAQFGHWICEQLPQLRGIEAVSKIDRYEIPLLLNSNPTKWQVESLRLMGFEPSRLIANEWNGVRVKSLVVCSLRNVHSRGMEFDPKARNWVADRLRKRIEELPIGAKTEPLRYVLRQDQVSRRVKNTNPVESLLGSFGYVSMNPGLRGIEADMVEAHNVRVFVGVFGSGLINLMFANQPQYLVEIFGPDQIDREVFFLLASELGVAHLSVDAKVGTGDIGDETLRGVTSPLLEVNLASLKLALRTIHSSLGTGLLYPN